jgi:hypothetical protein
MARDILSRLGALTAGAALLGLGVNEALRLAGGDVATARMTARRIGAARMLAGGAFLVRPNVLPALLGLNAGSRAMLWVIRLFAVRECALGTGVLTAARTAGDPLPWLLTVSSVAAAEAAVITAALRRGAITPARGRAFAAADVGSALTGVGALVQMRRRARGDLVADRADGPRPSRVASQWG